MAVDGALQIKARRYLDDLRGDVASQAQLQAVSRTMNLDVAAMLYYESLVNSRRDFEFIRVVNAMKAEALTRSQRLANAEVEIIIVPSVFSFVSRWEGIGAVEIESLRARLRKLGFKTDVAQTLASSTLEENAQRIGRAVIESTASSVILVSRGRGSLETRLLFHALANGGFDLTKISGWISLSAPLNGSRSLEDDFYAESLFGQGRSLRRMKLEAGARVARESIAALRAAAKSQPPWASRLPLPERVSLVQIVGVCRREQLSHSLRARYDAMKEFGPNDGVQLLSEAHIDAGLVVPVWGLQPSAPWSVSAGLIERTALMIAGLPIQNVTENQGSDDGRVGFDHEARRF
jgi:hypothetical protein